MNKNECKIDQTEMKELPQLSSIVYSPEGGRWG